jgi:hypothetical protein
MATVQEIFSFAAQEAERQGVSPDLVQRMIKQESGGNATAMSPKGAYGPMQLMEGTAKDLGVDRTDPFDNVRGGIKYISQLLNQFQDPRLALAAYNAGPGNVRKYGDVPPFKETQNYVNKIIGVADRPRADSLPMVETKLPPLEATAPMVSSAAPIAAFTAPAVAAATPTPAVETKAPMAETKAQTSDADEWTPVTGIKGQIATNEWTPVTGIGGIPTSQVKPQSFMGDVQTGVTQAIKGGTPTSNAILGGINILSSLINRGLTSAGMNVGPNSAQAELDRRAAESAAQPKRTIGETFSAIGDIAVNRPGLLLGSLAVPDPTSVFLPGRIAGATTQALKTAGTTARTAERIGQVAGAAGTGVTQAALNQVGAPNADQFMTEAGLSLLTAPVAAIGGARTPKTQAPLNRTQEIAAKAVQEGYVMSPTSLSPTFARGTAEKLMGKSDFASTASLKNVDLATNQAKQIIGLPAEQQLTSDAFRVYRKDQGNAYQAVRNFDYKTDKVFVKELNDEIQKLRSLTTTSPEQISTLQALAKTNIKGDDLVNNIIDLRDAGNSNMRSADSKLNRLGRTQLKTATVLEDVADRFLAKSGNPDVVSQFRQARQNIAQSHTIENAFDAAGNIIDPRKLAAMARKDQPIPSALRTAAEAANKAPDLFTPQKNFFGGRSPGLTDVVTGVAAGAITGNPLLAAGAVARPAIREILTTGPVQRMMSPNIPLVGPMRPSDPNRLLPYMATTPFQPVTQGLIDYMNQNNQRQ